MQLKASYKSIWEIAYPIMLGSLAQNIITLTDTIFLGRVGETEQGACGLISIYYLVFVMVGLGISRGAQIMIARRAGQQKYDEISALTHNLLYLQIFAASILFLFLYLASPTILWLFIESKDIYDASLAYLNYRIVGLFFSFGAFVLMALYTSIGKTKVIAWITAVLCSVNVFLNYSLIFGEFGFPKMGIEGAALASTIAEAIAGLGGIIYIYFDKNVQPYHLFQLSRPNKQMLSKMFTTSTPLVLQYLIGLGGWFIFFSLIEKMGAQALAASVVLKIIYTIYSIPAWGFGSAVNAVVSNIIGQKLYKDVFVAINKTTVLSASLTLISCVSLLIFPDAILGAFSKEPAVIELAKEVTWVIISIAVSCSISVVIFNGFMGTGATMISLIIEVFAVICYLSYGYIIIHFFNLGLSYVWGAEMLYWVLLAIITWGYLQTGRWKRVSV